jgi:predicted TPR repeat methyltransferase
MSSVAEKFQRALARHQSGDLAGAEAGYRKVLVRSPRDVTALYHLGIVLHQQAKPEEARQVLARVLEYAPDFPEANLSLGVVLVDLKRYEEAEVPLRAAISLSPKMQKALSRLGEVLVLQKKYSEALSPLRTALQLFSNDVKAVDALVVALRQLELFEEAVEVSASALGFGKDEHQARMAESIYLLYRRNPELARRYAQGWIEAYPDNPFPQHIGVGVLGLPAPARASSDYVKTLFDGFAASFEQQLSSLGYRAQDIVGDITDVAAAKAGLVVLDAGCGTGMAAAKLRERASTLVGVDLSPRMLEKAREKGLYDELVEMDLGEFLRVRKETFDLIVAADVLNYFGELGPILLDASNALLPAGRLSFSVERGERGAGFTLGPHGRYCHEKGYVVDLIERAGLILLNVQDIVLRYEFGKPVDGLLITAAKPAGASG